MSEFSARTICLNPCPPSGTILKLQVPFAGVMTAVGDLSLQGGCTDCKLVSNLLIQLQPVFTSLGIPLCLLGCVGSVVGVLTALKDVLTDLPLPNVVPILTKLSQLIPKCACVITSFTPLGVIDFVKMIRDFLSIVIAIMGCVTSLLNHLITLNLKAALRLTSLNVDVQKTGQCLQAYTKTMTQQLTTKLSIVTVIFELLGIVFSFVEAILPFPSGSGFSDIAAFFTDFTSVISSPSVGAGDVIQTISGLVASLTTVRDLISTIIP